MAREAASNAAAEGATNCMSPTGQTLAASARQHRSYAAGYLTDHLGNRAAFLALTGTAGCALLLATLMPETRPMDESDNPIAPSRLVVAPPILCCPSLHVGLFDGNSDRPSADQG